MSHVFRLRNSLSESPASRTGEAYILVDEDGLPASDRILASCQKVSLSGPVAHHPEVEAKFSKMVEGITYECDTCHLVTDYAGLCHKHEQLPCEVVGQHFAVYQVMAK